MSVGTPYSLEGVHDVVQIFVLQIDDLDGDLLFIVRERTKVSVLARAQLVRVGLAELALVATGMVQLLDLVMCPFTVLVHTALFAARNVLVFREIAPATIPFVMVVEASLAFVKF